MQTATSTPTTSSLSTPSGPQQIPPQVWIGDSRPYPDDINEIEPSTDTPSMKPKGGLWTSPLLERTGKCIRSPWIDLMRRDSWNPYDNPKAWILYPDNDLELYFNSREDLEEISIEDDRTLSFTMEYRIDWEQLFAEHEALVLPPNGWTKGLLGGIRRPNLSTWGCNSVLWSGWHFDAIEYIGPVSI